MNAAPDATVITYANSALSGLALTEAYLSKDRGSLAALMRGVPHAETLSNTMNVLSLTLDALAEARGVEKGDLIASMRQEIVRTVAERTYS